LQKLKVAVFDKLKRNDVNVCLMLQLLSLSNRFKSNKFNRTICLIYPRHCTPISIKIGQHLLELCTKVFWFVCLRPTLYHPQWLFWVFSAECDELTQRDMYDGWVGLKPEWAWLLGCGRDDTVQ